MEAEELQGVFVKFGLDGTGKDAKQQRLQILEETYGTRAWSRICDMPSERINEGRKAIVARLEAA